ncbi:tetratricopeptide repeat protein [Streptomyces echinatus]|uniref:tetratricopeptide repeat protein n=1 Tax=Streptomyces echinatus TaxID=67293 RepID=UPI00381EDB88
MKHNTLLAGLIGVAAVATGVAAWAIQSRTVASSESKAPPPAYEDADALLQKGILQDQNHDPKAAARSYQRALDLEPDNKFAWFNLGVVAQEVGNTDDARAAYERSLRIDPAFPPALFNEALLFETSAPDRAVALLERATDADPKAATAHLHLGRIWARKEDADKAAVAFRRAVAIDPSLINEVPEEFRDSASPGPESRD